MWKGILSTTILYFFLLRSLLASVQLNASMNLNSSGLSMSQINITTPTTSADEPMTCYINECSYLNGNCEHSCEDLIIGYKCLCPVGYKLSEDERSCHVFSCSEGQFMCEEVKQCIPAKWKCDIDNDCMDRSDERNCTNITCTSLNKFSCANGNCLEKFWVCDRAVDCSDDGSDKSDEEHCDHKKLTCEPSEFLCEDGEKCIKGYWKCDGDKDCADESDEKDCTSTCLPTDFQCTNKNCIDESWKCDNENDCGDNSDEEPIVCPGATCRPGYFPCNESICIRNEWACDSETDCSDGSDEQPPICNKKTDLCPDGYFQCQTSKNTSCLHKQVICNGHLDCSDGSDEKDCLTLSDNHQRCKGFLCRSGQCISNKKVCNGIYECQNGDDERHCKFHCKKGYFRCGYSYQCINESLVCDGHFDCKNAADEPMTCYINECSYLNGNCEHSCEDLIIGYKCLCPVGYKLSEDGRSCHDINECSIYGFCSQLCENTVGSYKCSCLLGYILINGNYCKALGPLFMLLFSDQNSIFMLVNGSSKIQVVAQDLQSTVGISYFSMSKLIYWSDVKDHSIYNVNLKKPGEKHVAVYGVEKPDGICVDWISLKLYWVGITGRVIEVSELNGDHRSILVSTGLVDPRSIAVNPSDDNRFIYWSDWGPTAKIERISMDGDPTTRLLIFERNNSWPNGLVVDFTIQKLFWVDAIRKSIECSNLDGSDHNFLFEVKGFHPFSVAIFEDYAYWTDWMTGSVNRMNKFTGKSHEILHDGLIKPMGISICHPMLQPPASNPCVGAFCSHLCFLSQLHGYKCACPTGFHLLHDNQTCNTSDAYDCRDDFCMRDGLCYNVTSGQRHLPQCQCPLGFGGRRCENRVEILKAVQRNGHTIHVCVPGYCLYGSTCTNTDAHGRPMDRAKCICMKGFYGERCEHNYEYLYPRPQAPYSQQEEDQDGQKDNDFHFLVWICAGLACGSIFLLVVITAAMYYCLVSRKRLAPHPMDVQ